MLVDELVNLYKIPNAVARQYNYEKILTMYNDTLQGRASYLGIIMSGTPQCVEDRRRGLYSYEALRSRLAQGRFASEGHVDMLAPVIRLQPLTPEELFVLVEKLADIHAGFFGYERVLREEDLVAFLQVELARVGADSHITPREIIRDFVELLDILYQNPALTLEELVNDPAFSQRPATLPCEEGEGSVPSAAPAAGLGRAGSGRYAAQQAASSPSFAAGDVASGLGQASAPQQGNSLYDEVIQSAAPEAPGTQRVAAEPVAAPRTFAEFTI